MSDTPLQQVQQAQSVQSAQSAQPTPKKAPPPLGPHSIEAEEAVLGAVLIENDVLAELIGILQPDDFFEKKHEWIWQAYLRLYEAKPPQAIDPLSVSEVLRAAGHLDDVGGTLYLNGLMANTPTYIYAATYALIVQQAATRRRLMEAAGKIAQIARNEDFTVDEAVSNAEAELFKVSDGRTKHEVVSISEALVDYSRVLEDRYLNQDQPVGTPSGFRDLDHLLGGLQKSDLIIVAARPGVGKTSFLLAVALNAARLGDARTVIFSLEMGREQLLQRFYALETGIDSTRLRRGNITEQEYEQLVEATGRLNELPIFIDDTAGISIQQMRARARRLHKEHRLGLIVVDYLQLVTSGTTRLEGNRVQEISFISRGLKELARELNVPLIAAAQLSRAVESRAEKRPMLSDLRESGSIEQDADIVMFLYRDELYNKATEYPNQAELIIGKHRNGGLGTIRLGFRKELTQFTTIERDTTHLGQY